MKIRISRLALTLILLISSTFAMTGCVPNKENEPKCGTCFFTTGDGETLSKSVCSEWERDSFMDDYRDHNPRCN